MSIGLEGLCTEGVGEADASVSACVSLSELSVFANMPKALVAVDGSFGEGGGQILRASLALSALLDKSLVITNIRASRPRPGLAAQHLAGALAVQVVSRMQLDNAQLKSCSINLSVGSGNRRPWLTTDLPLELDYINTAGSTALVLQAVLPCLLRCVLSLSSEEKLSGQTLVCDFVPPSTRLTKSFALIVFNVTAFFRP